MLHDLPSLGCLSKTDTSTWPQVIVQESLAEAVWPVISRITKGKFFPCPFGKLPLFRRKVYWSVLAGSSSLFWGRPKTIAWGQQDALPSQMPTVGLISPVSSTQITPGSQALLHISGGENHSAVLQRVKSCAAVTTSTHPSLPISISFQAHLFLPTLVHLEKRVKRAFSK